MGRWRRWSEKGWKDEDNNEFLERRPRWRQTTNAVVMSHVGNCETIVGVLRCCSGIMKHCVFE